MKTKKSDYGYFKAQLIFGIQITCHQFPPTSCIIHTTYYSSVMQFWSWSKVAVGCLV